MEEQPNFTTVLRSFMARAVRTNKDLARLTGIALPTIENWTAGKVRRPRFVQDVLQLAHALALDEIDTTALLLAAGHHPLAQLQANSAHLGDPQLVALLRTWVQTNASPDPSSTMEAMPRPRLAPRHQLRSPVADFVGRDQEVERLVDTLRSAVATGRGAVISGVQGMGGIGKTELAYAVAYRLHDVFPDAQIVLNLRGTSSEPLTPAQILQTVVHTFAPDTRLPEDLDLLQQHYQSVLYGQRVLLLADDARDAAQVRPLLPPTSCALLITSRTRFTLPGMTTIDLELLPAETASRLLCTICPRLSEAEAQALARACAYLPLALRVSGGLLRTTPALLVANYLRKLADARQHLEQLRDPDDGQLDVAASLALSYALLDARTQQLFRQLGVFVVEFPAALARDVVEIAGEEDVEALLHVLLRRNLVIYDPVRGRWRLHDLVRVFAHRVLEDAGELDAVAWRYARAVVVLAQDIKDQYLAADDMALPALARFDAERAHIGAAQHWAQSHMQTLEGDQLLLDIAETTRHIGELRYDCQREILPLWEDVRMAAKRLGNRTEEGYTLNYLGIAYGRLGELPKAIAYFEQALATFCEQDNRLGEGITLSNLGLAYYHQGKLSKAIACHEQAFAIAREIGNRRGEGRALNNQGLAYSSLGELSTAISCYQQRLVIARAIGDRYGEGITLNNLGKIYTELGDTRHAIELCKAALMIARAIGDRHEEGYTLSYLARAQALQGDMAQASSTSTQAFALLQEIGDRRGEAECNWLFGLALAQQGELSDALPLLRAAVAYQQEIGHTKAEQHAALVARLEAGEALPPELHIPKGQCAIEGDSDRPTGDDVRPETHPELHGEPG